MTNQLSVGVALFIAIVLFNQWRRGTLGQWLRAKVLGVTPTSYPPNVTGQGGSFTGPATNPASRASGGGGGGAW